MPDNVRASAPGAFSALRCASAEITKTGTTVTVDALAVGDVIVNAWVEVTEVFNAVTTNVITLGTTATADAYIDASGVTEGTAGVYPTGGIGPFAATAAATNLVLKYAQTGTAATTGKAHAYALIANLPE